MYITTQIIYHSFVKPFKILFPSVVSTFYMLSAHIEQSAVASQVI